MASHPPPPRFLLSPSNATASLLAVKYYDLTPCHSPSPTLRAPAGTPPFPEDHMPSSACHRRQRLLGHLLTRPRRTSRRLPARASRRAPLHAGALTWLLFCGFLAGGAAECPAQNESSPSTMACDSANTACAPGDYCQNFSSAPCAFPLCRQQIVPMGGADLRKVRLPSEKPQLYTLCAV